MTEERTVLIGLDGLPHITRNAWLKCKKCSTKFRTSLPWQPDFVVPVCLVPGCSGTLELKPFHEPPEDNGAA